jgi:hypothetical protein
MPDVDVTATLGRADEELVEASVEGPDNTVEGNVVDVEEPRDVVAERSVEEVGGGAEPLDIIEVLALRSCTGRTNLSKYDDPDAAELDPVAAELKFSTAAVIGRDAFGGEDALGCKPVRPVIRLTGIAVEPLKTLSAGLDVHDCS